MSHPSRRRLAKVCHRFARGRRSRLVLRDAGDEGKGDDPIPLAASVSVSDERHLGSLPVGAEEPSVRSIVILQTGRSGAPRAAPRRRAQLESVATTSGAVSRRTPTAVRPSEPNVVAMRSTSVGPKSPRASPAARSRAVTDSVSSRRPPGATSRAIDVAASSSQPSAPRSSEPHGNRTVRRPARPSIAAGSRSTPDATKQAFVRPPREGRAAARLEDSAIARASASTPSTNASGPRPLQQGPHGRRRFPGR